MIYFVSSAISFFVLFVFLKETIIAIVGPKNERELLKRERNRNRV